MTRTLMLTVAMLTAACAADDVVSASAPTSRAAQVEASPSAWAKLVTALREAGEGSHRDR